MFQSPLRQFHESQKARFVEFAGWEMPILYRSIVEEHKQVREQGGLFDVSHMGRLRITGKDARQYLETLLTRKVTDMKVGQVRYGLICNEQGGVKDDILVYRDELDWMLVVNASNRNKIVEHMKTLVGALSVQVDDMTLQTAMIALQGPAVMPCIIEQLPDLAELKRYQFTRFDLMGNSILISRTGYTGEDGIEAIFPTGLIDAVFEMLVGNEQLVSEFPPAGLGARDTLRIEAGMPLYGHELSEEINPLAARLKFAVSLDKGQDERVPKFVGQDALQAVAEAGPQRQLVGLKVEGKRTPRQGATVLKDGASIGQVSSGCLSPTFNVPIAMAFVEAKHADADQVEIDLGRKTITASVCKLPFYKPSK